MTLRHDRVFDMELCGHRELRAAFDKFRLLRNLTKNSQPVVVSAASDEQRDGPHKVGIGSRSTLNVPDRARMIRRPEPAIGRRLGRPE